MAPTSPYAVGGGVRIWHLPSKTEPGRGPRPRSSAGMLALLIGGGAYAIGSVAMAIVAHGILPVDGKVLGCPGMQEDPIFIKNYTHLSL